MKKSVIILISLVLLGLIAWLIFFKEGMKPSEPTNSQQPQPERPLTQTEATHKLVQTDAYASCFVYELQTAEGEPVTVPEHISEWLDCPSGALALSHDGRFLVYERVDDFGIIDLKTFDLSTQDEAQLMSFVETRDGIRCIWKTDHSAVACISVNQQEYEGLTKLHVLEIDEEGMLAKKHDFAQTSENTAAFVCGATCMPEEFSFNEDRSVTYQVHHSEGRFETVAY